MSNISYLETNNKSRAKVKYKQPIFLTNLPSDVINTVARNTSQPMTHLFGLACGFHSRFALLNLWYSK